MWEQALDEEGSNLSDDVEMVKEARSESKQETDPLVIVIHEVSLSVF
jgi:poly-gamma-glutamate capsule biosynthesis protein CapA/YwtB (metallophosphatase superfamily)